MEICCTTLQIYWRDFFVPLACFTYAADNNFHFEKENEATAPVKGHLSIDVEKPSWEPTSGTPAKGAQQPGASTAAGGKGGQRMPFPAFAAAGHPHLIVLKAKHR